MKKFNTLFLLILFIIPATAVHAQFGEPELQTIEKPKNLFDEGYKKGFGFSFELSDFGFGAGMQYRMGLSAYNEGIINLGLKGLRDPSEQTYIDYYFGNRTIPSKYRKVVTVPMSIGFKHRFFAEEITDNFRVHTSVAVGPALALVSGRILLSFQSTNLSLMCSMVLKIWKLKLAGTASLYWE